MPRTSRSSRAPDDAELVERLREGDESAFRLLMGAYDSPLLRVAVSHVRSRAVAEEVVQETWLAVLRGIGGFEQRSSLKTWIFRILTNIAATRGAREARTVPFSLLRDHDGRPREADRFLEADHPSRPGAWASAPTPWPTPEAGLLAGETREVVRSALQELPSCQRAVVSLRDLEGWSAKEVCEALGLTDGNQRVLLHRGRTDVRRALERYHEDAVTPAR